MKELGRLLTAIVTPFDEKGQVDYALAKKLAKALLDSGSDGIVVAGSTGESATLSPEEKLRLFAEIKSAVTDKGSVVAATGSYDTAETIRLTKEAEEIGVDAVLLVVPYYNRPTQDGLYQHFKAIAEATSLPCILYNVPSRTVASVSAETVAKLSAIENIVGIKEASSNFEQIGRMMSSSRKGFKVWSGNDSDTFLVMALGGYGVISVTSHLVGNQIKQMIELCVKGKTEEARTIHHKLMKLNNGLFIVSNPMPIKHAFKFLGCSMGKTRLPLTEPDENSRVILERILGSYEYDLPLIKKK